MNRGNVTLAAMAAIGLVLLAAGSKTAPGGSVKVPATTTEDLPSYAWNPPPGTPVMSVSTFEDGYVYTAHRYPRVIGGEISNAIHHGFQSMALPQEGDMLWLSAPPSEEMV